MHSDASLTIPPASGSVPSLIQGPLTWFSGTLEPSVFSMLSDMALFILPRNGAAPVSLAPTLGDSGTRLGVCHRGDRSHARSSSRTGEGADSPCRPRCPLASESGDQLLASAPDGLPELREGAAPTKGLGRTPGTPVSLLCHPGPPSPGSPHKALLTCCCVSPAVPVLGAPGDRWGHCRGGC